MKLFKVKTLFLLVLIAFNSIVTSYGQTVVYVKYNATGLNNGTSWTNAFTHLVDAVNAAPANAEIWIAYGSPYKVSKTNSVTNKIIITKPLSFYGGFVGTETSKTQVTSNTSLISGDLGVQFDYSDNSNTAFQIKNTTVSFKRIEFRFFNNEASNALGVIVSDTNSIVNIKICLLSDNIGEIRGTCISAFKGSKISMDSSDIRDNRLTKFGALVSRSDDAEINMSNGNIISNGTSIGGYIFNSLSTSQASNLVQAKKNLINIYNVYIYNNTMAPIYSYFGSIVLKRCRMDLNLPTSTYSINMFGDSTSLFMDSCYANGNFSTNFIYASTNKKITISNSNFLNTSASATTYLYLSSGNVNILNTNISNLRGSNPIYIYAYNGTVNFDNFKISDSDVSSYLLNITTSKFNANGLNLINNKASIGNYYYCNEANFTNLIIDEFDAGDVLGIGNIPKVTFDKCSLNAIRQTETLFRSNVNADVSITNTKVEHCFMTQINPYKAFLFSVWNGSNYFVANCKFNNLYPKGNLVDNNGDLFFANCEFKSLALTANKNVFNNSKKLWVFNSNIEAMFNKVFLNDTSYYGKSAVIDFRLVNSIAYTFYDTVIHHKVYDPMFTSLVSNNISNKTIIGPNSVSNCSVTYAGLYDLAYDYIYNKGLTPSGITQYPVIDYFGAPRVMGGTVDIGMKEYQVTTDVFTSSSTTISSIKVFPNPTVGVVNILSDEKTNIQIVDQEGQVLYENLIEKGVTTLELNSLKNGVYFIRYLSDTNSKVDKLIVMK